MHPLTIIRELVDPIYFLLYVATYIPSTIFGLISTGQIRSLITPSAFKDFWFANFWKDYGGISRGNATPRAAPLIAQASGVVLDVGPGSGEWEQSDEDPWREPNQDHHAQLRERVKKAGLEDVYVICPVGVEDLTKSEGKTWDIGCESVDCVVTIQCLCSIPRPKDTMRELYSLLKGGGKWVLYEHVIVYEHQRPFMKWYQAMIDVIWPSFLGGCSITRDTAKWMKECGSWNKVDLKQPEDEVPMEYHCVPHLMGTLTKCDLDIARQKEINLIINT